MKIRGLVLLISIFHMVVSCTPAKKTIHEKLEGKWVGGIEMEIDVSEIGSHVIQSITAEIELDYKGDSTFTSLIIAEKYYNFKLDGNAHTKGSTLDFTGNLVLGNSTQVTGEIGFNEDKSIYLKYSGLSPDKNVVYKGMATLEKKVE